MESNNILYFAVAATPFIR